MDAVKVESVSKTFGSFKAIRNVSLAMEEGEIRGLLGPNGSGKSTTMKIILGILKPDSGLVKVYDLNVSERPIEARMNMGYVPEMPYLYEYLTAAEYLDFGVFLMGSRQRSGRREWTSCCTRCRWRSM